MRIAVIGAGAMGAWLTKHLMKRHSVKVYDIVRERAERLERIGAHVGEDLQTVLKDVDAAVLATPISEIPRMAREVSRLMTHGVLIEISSLKLPVIESLKELPERITPISIHPLFGPTVKDLRGEKIALIPLRSPQIELKYLRELFEGAEFLTVSAEEHDKMMAYILSLTHVISLASASSIGEDLKKLAKFSGRSFRSLMEMMDSTLRSSPELFTQLILLNPYSRDVVLRYMRELDKIMKVIESEDFDELRELYERVRETG